MSLSLHLTFDGACQDALTLYARVLGGTITYMATYGESPMAGQVPPEWHGRIMHATLTIPGGLTLMGNDVQPGGYDPPQGFGVVIGTGDPGAARRAFEALAEGGAIRVPLGPTFWAIAFGVVTDRFGVTWEINCEQAPGDAPTA
jgi:PhnB protein